MENENLPGGQRIRSEKIHLQKELNRDTARCYRLSKYAGHKGLKSTFRDPYRFYNTQYGPVRTYLSQREVSFRVLRQIAGKAWIINVCINSILRKVNPYLKLVSDKNIRGFRIREVDTEASEAPTVEQKKRYKECAGFLLKTGNISDDERDDIYKYTAKILRDLVTIDQIFAELQYTKNGKSGAFWAVDAATIEKVVNPDECEEIRFVQVIDGLPQAFFNRDEAIFDYQNARTDVEHSGYGYSFVEQAVDLVVASVNTFAYNAGYFTESKLPKGMILVQGDMDEPEVEEMTDWIEEVMSGNAGSMWRIPIIPSGSTQNNERKIEWVKLQESAKDMEFQVWYDSLMSAIVSLLGLSMEDLGFHSQKSQPLIGADMQPSRENTKSLMLGDILGFLQRHFNKIIEKFYPDLELEFVGYEKDDPTVKTRIDESEISTFKTLDEKRVENGLSPLGKWWSEVPQNPQVVQMVMSERSDQQQEQALNTDEDGAGENKNEQAEESWKDIEENASEDVQKSLSRFTAKRIVI